MRLTAADVWKQSSCNTEGHDDILQYSSMRNAFLRDPLELYPERYPLFDGLRG